MMNGLETTVADEVRYLSLISKNIVFFYFILRIINRYKHLEEIFLISGISVTFVVMIIYLFIGFPSTFYTTNENIFYKLEHILLHTMPFILIAIDYRYNNLYLRKEYALYTFIFLLLYILSNIYINKIQSVATYIDYNSNYYILNK